MALNYELNVDKGWTTILLSGNLIEYSSVLDGIAINPGSNLKIDLSGVEVISSWGIHNFNSWVYNLKCSSLKFFNCPYSFVNQLNLLNNFLPAKSEIESFYVPYYCETSNEEIAALFKKNIQYKKQNGVITLIFPELNDSQGNRMEIDVLVDHYFRFLNYYY